MGLAQTTSKNVRHILSEDGGAELFKIQNITLIKQAKQLMGDLRVGTREGEIIKSNLNYI